MDRILLIIFSLTPRTTFCVLNDVSNKGDDSDDDNIGNNEKGGCL